MASASSFLPIASASLCDTDVSLFNDLMFDIPASSAFVSINFLKSDRILERPCFTFHAFTSPASVKMARFLSISRLTWLSSDSVNPDVLFRFAKSSILASTGSIHSTPSKLFFKEESALDAVCDLNFIAIEPSASSTVFLLFSHTFTSFSIICSLVPVTPRSSIHCDTSSGFFCHSENFFRTSSEASAHSEIIESRICPSFAGFKFPESCRLVFAVFKAFPITGKAADVPAQIKASFVVGILPSEAAVNFPVSITHCVPARNVFPKSPAVLYPAHRTHPGIANVEPSCAPISPTFAVVDSGWYAP